LNIFWKERNDIYHFFLHVVHVNKYITLRSNECNTNVIRCKVNSDDS
jgi:hypothetical protein